MNGYDNKNDNGVRFIAGVITLITCLVIVLSLFNIFGSFGVAIKHVILGLFGQSSYALFLAGLVVGVALIFNLTVYMSRKSMVKYSLMLASAITIIHIITSRGYMEGSIGSYISNVYNNGFNTGGGAVNAILVCLPLRFLGFVTTLVFNCLIFVSLVFFSSLNLFYTTDNRVDTRNTKLNEIQDGVDGQNQLADSQQNDLFIAETSNKKRKSDQKSGIGYVNAPIDDDENPVNFSSLEDNERRKNKAYSILFSDEYNPKPIDATRTENSQDDFVDLNREKSLDTMFDFNRISKEGSIFSDLNNSSRSNSEPITKDSYYNSSNSRDSIRASQTRQDRVTDFSSRDIFGKIDGDDTPRSLPTNRTNSSNSFDSITRQKPSDSFIMPSESPESGIEDISPRRKLRRNVEEPPLFSAFHGDELNDIAKNRAEDNSKTDKYSDLLSHSNKTNDENCKFNKTYETINNEFKASTASKKTISALTADDAYTRPPIDLLIKYPPQSGVSDELLREKATILEQTLADFKIDCKVVKWQKGPSVVRFALKIADGIQVGRINQYNKDISLKMASEVNILTPIPNESFVGVEVANPVKDMVSLRDMIEAPDFFTQKGLSVPLGKNLTGSVVYCNILKMPHLLIAGTTGSGKSACMSSIICSLLYRFSPKQLKLVLIDPKRVEFTPYANLPHLMLSKIICDADKALNALNWIINEMEARYTSFENEHGVRNIDEYNAKHPDNIMPYIVVIVDELADLLSVKKKDFEAAIQRIAQKSRAAGIHMILATQRPSADVITGVIKSNFPSRIAFTVKSNIDSRVILDDGGAEKLLGNGDMLYYPTGYSSPERIQGAFVTSNEVQEITDFVREHNKCEYDDVIEKEIQQGPTTSAGVFGEGLGGDIGSMDPLTPKVLKNIIETGNISISKIQLWFSIGYQRSARIMNYLEQAGYVSEPDKDNKGQRKLLITMDEFMEKFKDV